MVLDLAYRTGVPWNETSYSNPEFDKLLTEADSTIDINKRREVIGKLETIMHEDGPVAQPLWRTMFTFWHESVLGYTMHPSQYFSAPGWRCSGPRESFLPNFASFRRPCMSFPRKRAPRSLS